MELTMLSVLMEGIKLVIQGKKNFISDKKTDNYNDEFVAKIRQMETGPETKYTADQMMARYGFDTDEQNHHDIN